MSQSPTPTPPPPDTARRWRALPDDLPYTDVVRWCHGHGIACGLSRCDLGEIHHVALLSEAGYDALLRDLGGAR